MWLSLIRGLGRLGLGLPRGFWALVAIGWASWIWYLSTLEGLPIPGTFGWSLLANTAHAPLFGLLGLWLAFALPRDGEVTARGWARLTPRTVGLVLLIVAAWAGTDEWHQSWVDGRTASLLDWFTDMTGTSVILWIATVAGRSEGAPRMGWRLALGAVLCFGVSLIATVFSDVI